MTQRPVNAAAAAHPGASAGAGSSATGDDALVIVDTVPLGGSALSRFIQERRAPADWDLAVPDAASGWAERVAETQAAFTEDAWWRALAPAVHASGAARRRLERVVKAGGVVVTTGQQPGLFGGPVYTWSKALSALALADEIERITGVPAAPLFWAATDDADLAEAQRVWVALEGGALELRGTADAPPGTPASAVAQGDLGKQLAVLREASGSGQHDAILAATEAAYANPRTTIGDAYVALLESVLSPLAIPILDASHGAVRAAGSATVRRAMAGAESADAALKDRTRAIRSHGFEPQVADVAGLTPAFVHEGGVKRRVTVSEAPSLASAAAAASLGPNVLLRPIVEAAIVPTVAYVAGPGEVAYFAQVTALARAIEARVPVAVPRWSGRIVEPRIQRLLERLGVDAAGLADPHDVERRLARAAMPGALAGALTGAADAVTRGLDAIGAADTTGLVPPAVLDGVRKRLEHQLARLERRVVASVKRREAMQMRDAGTARGYFFPGGKPQERALSLVPFLARNGPRVLEAMLAEARRHARTLVNGGGSAGGSR